MGLLQTNIPFKEPTFINLLCILDFYFFRLERSHSTFMTCRQARSNSQCRRASLRPRSVFLTMDVLSYALPPFWGQLISHHLSNASCNYLTPTFSQNKLYKCKSGLYRPQTEIHLRVYYSLLVVHVQTAPPLHTIVCFKSTHTNQGKRIFFTAYSNKTSGCPYQIKLVPLGNDLFLHGDFSESR